ncbi:MAG: hypothetical protein IT372_31075 [Polyangiaceae bacterium]|nr:hypothetical protein [Polyangiaceae bacterium]
MAIPGFSAEDSLESAIAAESSFERFVRCNRTWQRCLATCFFLPALAKATCQANCNRTYDGCLRGRAPLIE